MSWFREHKSSWVRSFCVNVLRAGPIPKHVAIIMDGNRRYALKQNLQKVEGHTKGFEKLAETLQWCNDLGINQVTVYAFSIENFKRSKEEVDGLMSLAQEKIKRLLEEKDKVMEHGVCIRVFGNLQLLPKEIQKLVAEVVLLSRDNNRAFLNVCLAYTSREEICHAVNEVSDGVLNGLIEPEDITESVLEKCLYSSHASDPDLLIRTSGEVRLSDFLLWQSSYSVLAFMKTLWPEFTFWHMCFAVLYYQLNCQDPKTYKELAREENSRTEAKSDWRRALDELKSKNGSCHTESDEQLSNTDFSHFKKRKEERISTFIQHIEDKKLQQLKDMVSSC